VTRWGVGPQWGRVTLMYAVLVVAAERIRPGMGDLPSSWHGIWLTGAGILLMLGAGVYMVTLQTLNLGLRNGALVTGGAFAVVRHPIYAAWILLLLPGLALLAESGLLLTVPIVAYLTFRAWIGREDRVLESKFGDAYRAYRLRTPELFPRLLKKPIPGSLKQGGGETR